MRKSIMVLLLGVSILVLIGLCIVQHQQIQTLSAKVASLERAAKPVASDSRAGNAAREVQQKQPVASTQKNAAETTAQTKPQAAVAVATSNATGSANGSPMAEMAKMMKNPAMKDMIRTQQKAHMDTSYGPLFKYLKLSDADMETFKNLLLDKQLSLMDISMDMMNKATTPEQRKATADRIKELTAGYDTRIKTFLGDRDYPVYQSFEETQPERMQVNMFKGTLSTGSQLTEDQEDGLIRAMHDARTSFRYSTTGVGDGQIDDPSQLTPERMARILEDSARLKEQCVTKAATILTPSQLEQFKASQEQMQALQEAGMKMAAKMFGTPAPTNSP